MYSSNASKRNQIIRRSNKFKLSVAKKKKNRMKLPIIIHKPLHGFYTDKNILTKEFVFV